MENTTEVATTATDISLPKGDTTAAEAKVSDQTKLVDKKELDHVLSDLQKWKSKFAELEREKAKTEERVKQAEIERMRQAQDWQKIAEIKEQEAKQAIEEKTRLKESIVYDRKFSEVRAAALKAGLRKEAEADLEMLSLDPVAIETTSTGRINVIGAEQFIEGLKLTRPHWFGSSKPSINSASPEVVASGRVTEQDIIELSKKARKTGDWSPVEKAYRIYNTQKAT